MPGMWSAVRCGRQVKSERNKRNPQSTSAVLEASVVRCQRHLLTLRPKKVDRGEVQGIEGAHGLRKRLQRACKNRRRQFKKGEALHEFSGELAVRCGKASRVKPRPELVLEKPAAQKRLIPYRRRRNTVFRE